MVREAGEAFAYDPRFVVFEFSSSLFLHAAQVQIAGEVQEITLFGSHACSMGAAVDEPAPIYWFNRPDLSRII